MEWFNVCCLFCSIFSSSVFLFLLHVCTHVWSIRSLFNVSFGVSPVSLNCCFYFGFIELQLCSFHYMLVTNNNRYLNDGLTKPENRKRFTKYSVVLDDEKKTNICVWVCEFGGLEENFWIFICRGDDNNLSKRRTRLLKGYKVKRGTEIIQKTRLEVNEKSKCCQKR